MKRGAWAPIAAATLALSGHAAYAQSGFTGAAGGFGAAGGVSSAGLTAVRPNVTANLTPGRAIRVDGRFYNVTRQGLVPSAAIGNAQQDVLLPGGRFGATGFNGFNGRTIPQGMHPAAAVQVMRSQQAAAMLPRIAPRMVGPRTFAPANLTPNRAGAMAVAPGRAVRINGRFFNVTPQGVVPAAAVGNAQQDVLLPGARLPAGFGTPAAVNRTANRAAPGRAVRINGRFYNVTPQGVVPAAAVGNAQQDVLLPGAGLPAGFGRPAAVGTTNNAALAQRTALQANLVAPSLSAQQVVTPVVTPVINPVVTPQQVVTPVVTQQVTQIPTVNGFTNSTLAQNRALAANTAVQRNNALAAQAAVAATRGFNPFTFSTAGRVNPFTQLPGDPAASRGIDPFTVGFFNDPFRLPQVNTVFDPFNPFAGRIPPTAVAGPTNLLLFPGAGGGGLWGYGPIGYNNLTGFIYPSDLGYAPGYYDPGFYGTGVIATPAPIFRGTAVRRTGTASPIRWTASADPQQQALKQSIEALSRTRPLKPATVTAVGETTAEVNYIDEGGQASVARVPLEEIFFFDVNQRLQSGATARDLVRVGVRVLVPVPESGQPDESVAGSRQETPPRVNIRRQ
ncbi:MAG: hypothetical protein ACK47B_24670 [Armatimonadota bacterium]